MLFNEPKLLKQNLVEPEREERECFSALQRAEIAESVGADAVRREDERFSALQRAEIAETPVAVAAAAR